MQFKIEPRGGLLSLTVRGRTRFLVSASSLITLSKRLRTNFEPPDAYLSFTNSTSQLCFAPVIK